MSVNGLYLITIRRYPGSRGFLVDILEDRKDPARIETVEDQQQLEELLSTFTPRDITLAEISRQMMLDPRPGETARTVQFWAIDTTPL